MDHSARPASSLLRDISVVRLGLFELLSLADVCRLLATCRPLRHDTHNVELLLQLSPVTRLVFHSHNISHLGCLPSETPPLSSYEASCASALSIAALWETDLLPMCYQWHHGPRISLRLEPFVLPLRDSAHNTADVQNALESVLTALGQAYHDGSDARETCQWDAREVLLCKALSGPSTDADTDTDEDATAYSEDSDWADGDSDSETLAADSVAVEECWPHSVTTPQEPRLLARVYRPLLHLLDMGGVTSTRWVRLPFHPDETNVTPWRSYLLVGRSATHQVLSGALVKVRAY